MSDLPAGSSSSIFAFSKTVKCKSLRKCYSDTSLLTLGIVFVILFYFLNLVLIVLVVPFQSIHSTSAYSEALPTKQRHDWRE